MNLTQGVAIKLRITVFSVLINIADVSTVSVAVAEKYRGIRLVVEGEAEQ